MLKIIFFISTEKSIKRPLDCEDVKTKKGNGIYKIYPNHSEFGFDVYCDYEIDNGGWTVINLIESLFEFTQNIH